MTRIRTFADDATEELLVVIDVAIQRLGVNNGQTLIVLAAHIESLLTQTDAPDEIALAIEVFLRERSVEALRKMARLFEVELAQ